MKLAKTYQAGDYEANIYALWESSGAFLPSGQGKPYSIVMPPPNANGNLHIGHALFVALEDILTRYHRMQGRDTIWIPGADHAGFETWVVFEKYLESQGKSRFEYSRDQLYQMTWDFVAENRGNMELQLRALGASCDWNSLVFTLDPQVTDVVFTTFKKMWDDGLIYRGERIVNYCPFHQTSFADIEVEYREEKGKLWYIDYPLISGQGSITVATTRPETMLGDEAVAVHPDDQRYAKLVGQKLLLPLVGKEIPIIADPAVEKDFGTGAVKVTPAHDPADFDIGQRHQLPLTVVIGDDGLMKAPAPTEFINLTVEQAREQVVEQLDHLGLISEIESIKHQVPHCYKCGRVIQPLPKEQWFVSVKPLVEKAIKAVEKGQIKFTPKAKGEELIRYYKELKDWNISRQIPWGIPIPAFRRVDKVGSTALDEPAELGKTAPDWIFDRRVDQEFIEVDGQTYKRDEDTFDAWFSSGQWPFIVTSGQLSRFYPTAVMETGHDILRPWVARMIMLGLYVTGQPPFAEVYLHGLVNDEKNQKMSKSKGNVVNPMDILGEYGSDALRLGVIANRSAGVNQAFSQATVLAGRNFCNKLWNIARFVEAGEFSLSTGASSADAPEGALEAARPSLLPQASPSGLADTPGTTEGSQGTEAAEPSLADHWVFRQLDQARQAIEKLLGEYRFAEAYEKLYHVIWDDVADWWVEASKLSGSSVAKWVLEYVLKLAHPFAPFVTETIWQSLLSDVKSIPHHFVDKTQKSGEGLLISQQWPQKLEYDQLAAAEFDRLRELVTETRYLLAEIGAKTGERTLYYDADQLIAKNAALIQHLARLKAVSASAQAKGLRVAAQNREAWLEISDAELAEHYATLENRLATAKTQILRLEARLANPSYLKNAPPQLVAETKTELADQKTLAERLSREMNDKN